MHRTEPAKNEDGERTQRMGAGISLVELIIYGALLALISVFVVNTLVIVNTTIVQTRIERTISADGELIMQKLIREARLASSFNGSSTFNVSPGVLSLSTIVSPSDYTATYADFYTDGAGALYFAKAAAAPLLLTAPDVAVTNLVFRRISTASSTYGVKFELTLSATGSQRFTIGRNFYGTAILRGSY